MIDRSLFARLVIATIVIGWTSLLIGRGSFATELRVNAGFVEADLTPKLQRLEYTLVAEKRGLYVIETAGYTQVRLELRDTNGSGKELGQHQVTDLVNDRIRVLLEPGRYPITVTPRAVGGVGRYQIRVLLSEELPQSVDNERFTERFYRKKWAVIIGVDKYLGGLTRLETLKFAVNDARAVGEALCKDYGFTCITTDASPAGMFVTLSDEAATYRVSVSRIRAIESVESAQAG